MFKISIYLSAINIAKYKMIRFHCGRLMFIFKTITNILNLKSKKQ